MDYLSIEGERVEEGRRKAQELGEVIFDSLGGRCLQVKFIWR